MRLWHSCHAYGKLACLIELVETINGNAVSVNLQGYTIGLLIQQDHGLTWAEAVRNRDGSVVMLAIFDGLYTQNDRQALTQLQARRERFYHTWTHVKENPLVGRVLGDLDDRPGVVYPREEGVSLRQWLAMSPGAVSPHVAIAFCVQLLSVLEDAHRVGVMHRAINPSTLWVIDGHTLNLRRVFGYGFATLANVEDNWERTSTLRGDAAYMAPEQFLQEELTASTDVYSVGLILYRLLVGYDAAQGDTMYALVRSHCDAKLRPIPQASWSPHLLACLHRALAREPLQRYADARQFKSDLLAEMEALTQAVRPPMPVSTHNVPLQGASITQPQVIWTDPSTKPLAHLTHEIPGRDDRIPSPPQAYHAREWTPRQAMAVDRERAMVASSTEAAPQEASAKTNPQPSAKTDSPSQVASHARSLSWRWIGAALLLVALIIGVWQWRDRWRSQPHHESLVADNSASNALRCVWTHTIRALDQGETPLSLSDKHAIVLDYDRMFVRVSSYEGAERSLISTVRAFGGVAMMHRHMPQMGRDWVFLTPRVQHTQRPTLWAIQFLDGQLIGVNTVVLSSDTIEDAHIALAPYQGECMVVITVEGDRGLGTPKKRMVLRMTDPGLVVADGALGPLWAPTLNQRPLEGEKLP